MDDFADLPGGALVVGGSGALGSAAADLLEERGARVGVTYRSTPVRRTPSWRLDLTDDGACARVVGEAVAALDGLHTLVYAAGPHVPMLHLSTVHPAPKAAVEAMVRGLAAEEGRYGVRANSVGPGMLTDGMAERLVADGELDERALDVARGNIPLRRFGSARDVAEAVAFLARRGPASSPARSSA